MGKVRKRMKDKNLEKTEILRKKAMIFGGRMQTIPKTIGDFAILYTPGVAAPCQAIQKDKEKVYEYTNKGNTIAIVSDGTRVLGLGDIGPEAGLPVMEGKSMLFKYLGGVDAVPICLNTKNPDEIIQTVKMLEPSFGGINLEDISNPKCFRILDVLRKEMDIPVWHDDQQGTAAVTLAGLINALKIVEKKIGKVSVTMIGAGAANIACSRILFAAGVNPKNCIVVDSKGILHLGRDDLRITKKIYAEKWKLCEITNTKQKVGNISDALCNADVCIALSRPGPGTIKPKWVESMNDNAIIFACANPIPEIWPDEAKKAGAKIVSTGRSDFPNQVNNSLGFPGIFRGTLDVRAQTITDEMCLAAAYALAEFAEKQGLNEDNVLPSMDNSQVFVEEAVAVGMKAQEQGIARLKISEEELRIKAERRIRDSRAAIHHLHKKGFIQKVE
jgi:malate dehydrogenase (oxaloacetate-decarboxylating)